MCGSRSLGVSSDRAQGLDLIADLSLSRKLAVYVPYWLFDMTFLGLQLSQNKATFAGSSPMYLMRCSFL